MVVGIPPREKWRRMGKVFATSLSLSVARRSPIGVLDPAVDLYMETISHHTEREGERAKGLRWISIRAEGYVK